LGEATIYAKADVEYYFSHLISFTQKY